MKKATLPLGMLLIALVAIMAAFLGRASTSGAASVTPTVQGGNPACPAGMLSFKINNAPANGVYDGDEAGVQEVPANGPLVVTISNSTGTSFDFATNFAVDIVIVKGGDFANVYSYPNETSSDSGLVAPLNSGGNRPTISHVTFCYDFELGVSKTAVTAFDRDFDWSITKDSQETDGSTAQDPFEVSENEDAQLDYRVVVTKSAEQDSNHRVSGTITVTNPHPTLAAQGVSVTDSITGGISATVDCAAAAGNQSTGLTIAGGGTLTCTYTAALPDDEDRTNTATATTTTVGIGSGTGTAAVSFANTTPTTTDDCANVSDTFTVTGAPNGSICTTTTFNYRVTIQSEVLDCGLNEINNTATVAATSDESEQTASEKVYVLKNCPEVGNGCTLTQGYWKNHGDPTRKQFDATWNLLPGGLGANTALFTSGKTWMQAFKTPVAGNPYWALAYQYMAAKLNILAGADSNAVAAALASAETYLAMSPTTKWSKTQKDAMTALAATLDRYNNGLTGPGHCSSDRVA